VKALCQLRKSEPFEACKPYCSGSVLVACRSRRGRKYYTLQVQPIAASGLLSNEFRFGSLFAPVGSELAMALKVEHENRTRLSQSGFRSPSARHRTSSDGGLCGGMLQCFRRRRTPRRGRNNCRLQPNVLSYRRIKPPRVHIDQYFARKEISRQESSGYRHVAITARTRRRDG